MSPEPPNQQITKFRNLAFFAIGALLLAVAAFLAGRSSVPTSTKTEEKQEGAVRYVEVESKEQAATIAQLRTELAQARKQVRTVVVTKRLPSGEVTRVRTTDSLSESSTASTTKTDATATAKEERAAAGEATESRSKVSVVEQSLAWWRLEAGLGAHVGLLLQGKVVPVGSAGVALRLGKTPAWLGLRFASDLRLDVTLAAEFR